jgi:uncharacterized protein with beta-barrel porin domain
MSLAASVFKPTISQLKGDATTRAAQAIIDDAKQANDAKTERLRAARLAHDAVQIDARTRVDQALAIEGGSRAAKAKRAERLTEYPRPVRAKRRQVGLE